MSHRWFFAFFVASGFCSLVFQVVWLRLAMAAFGVTSPLVAIVLSVFMAGLAAGSWAGGRLARRSATSRPASSLRLYALAELGIAIAGVAVPIELDAGRAVLSGLGASVSWGSSSYYLASGVWIAITLLPFTACMGATLPLGMAAIRRLCRADATRSFSYLYLANVVGAACGTASAAFVLIELLGFRGTSLAAASLNALVFATAVALSMRVGRGAAPAAAPADGTAASAASPTATRVAAAATATAATPTTAPWQGRGALVLLFLTGFMSIAMEVVWTRQFTPWLGTVVYAFAATLALYLVATTIGSRAYRAWAGSGRLGGAQLLWAWAAIGLVGLLPLLAADPRLPLRDSFLRGVLRVGAGVMPFCALTGFLTPMLVDLWSGGDPDRGGRAYAWNVLGCIAGPLVAGFALLPAMSERWALVALTVPSVLVGLLAVRSLRLTLAGPGGTGGTGGTGGPGAGVAQSWVAGALVLGVSVLLASSTRDYDSLFERRDVRRDNTATVVATGEGMHRRLLVNGVGITELTPVTKMMAHFPLAMLPAPPRAALVICFGMGTSFRSLLTWDIPVTAVELVPSVPGLFGCFHADAAAVLASPGAEVVIDDGRRFLERTRKVFDVVTIDAPPPVEAAGSSLLYTREFYRLLKQRLAPGGILQQWWPGGEEAIVCSVAQALHDEFPHVRAFKSYGGVGFHFLASLSPLPDRGAADLAARLPARATADLLEWGPHPTAQGQFEEILGRERDLGALLTLVAGVPSLQDDRPVNEYYLIRRRLHGYRSTEP